MNENEEHKLLPISYIKELQQVGVSEFACFGVFHVKFHDAKAQFQPVRDDVVLTEDEQRAEDERSLFWSVNHG